MDGDTQICPITQPPTAMNGWTIAVAAEAVSTCPLISLGLWQNFGGADVFETGRAVLRRAFDRGAVSLISTCLANNDGPPPGSAEDELRPLHGRRFPAYRDELVISTKAGYDMWPGPYGSWGIAQVSGRQPGSEPAGVLGFDYVDIFRSRISSAIILR